MRQLQTVLAITSGCLLALGGTCATWAAARCPPKYQITAEFQGPNCQFGQPPPSPRAINSTGQVAGYYAACFFGPDVPFVWTPAMGSALQPLALPPGVSGARVYGINNVIGNDGFGQMVGEMIVASTGYRAFLRTDGAMTNLGLLPGSNWSTANAVNDSSTVVGVSLNNITGPAQAFIWQDGRMNALSGLSGPNSAANAINSAGQITGWMGNGDVGSAHAFIWQNGTVLELPHVPGGVTSVGYAISEQGDVAGQGWYLDPVLQEHHWRGYVYLQGTAYRIDPLPGYIDAAARGINAAGQVVGFCQGDGKVDKAFLWQDGTTYDLSDLVPARQMTEGLAWAIDEQGRIVGTLAEGSKASGFVISPVRQPLGDVNCDWVVNVHDLLAVINQWGQCPSPDVSPCPADVAPPQGDGIVNVGDLLAVINSWG